MVAVVVDEICTLIVHRPSIGVCGGELVVGLVRGGSVSLVRP